MSGTDFKVGDVVKLQSGGPPMTITELPTVFSDKISVEWFVNGEIKRDAFRKECLRHLQWNVFTYRAE